MDQMLTTQDTKYTTRNLDRAGEFDCVDGGDGLRSRRSRSQRKVVERTEVDRTKLELGMEIRINQTQVHVNFPPSALRKFVGKKCKCCKHTPWALPMVKAVFLFNAPPTTKPLSYRLVE